MTETKLYSVGEAALKLKRSTQTVRTRAGYLSTPVQRAGRQGERLFTAEQIEEMRSMKTRVKKPAVTK